MSKVQRRRRQGEKKTVSDGEEVVNSEKVMDAPSATASSKSDLSTRSSDADSPHSQPATVDGKSTPTKTSSTPTRSSKSMFEFYNKNHGKGAGKGQAHKQAGPPSARSEADKSSTPQSAPAKVHGDMEDTTVTESDGLIPVIDYSALEESETHAAGSPKRENHKFERRNRRGRWKDEQHPNGSVGPYHKEKSNFVPRGGKAHASRRPSSRQFDRLSTPPPTKQNDLQTDDLVKQGDKAADIADSNNNSASPSTPSPEYFHRGGYRGRSRGDSSFQRGRGGYGRTSFRGGYRGNSRPGYIPPSQVTEPLAKQDDVDQLAERVSEATLASPTDHAAKQEEVTDTDETKQARLDALIEAKRELKREKNKKRRLAKRLSMRAGEHPSDSKETVQEEAKPESEPLKTTPPALPAKAKKANKPRKSKFQSEKQTGKAAEQATVDELEPSPESKSVPSRVAHVQAEVSSSKSEPSVSDNDEKPERHRKLNRDNSNSTTVPQPITNTDQQAPKPSTMDGNLEHQNHDISTSESGHHRPNSKRYPSRQEDSGRLSHAPHDSVPMLQQQIPSSVPMPTSSFVSQPVAFALASPNGGPIPVYTMPFQAMNPAMGDVQGGRQGMFYGPMMGSPAAAVSTSSSAPVPQPTMIDPNNMMYMPYDSQQMLMYNPYWYQAMAQQAIPPPNQVWNGANGGQPVDYNNWKQAGPERPHNDSNYLTTTAPGIAYNQHGEQMNYPNDNNNGPQAVYYYPVSY